MRFISVVTMVSLATLNGCSTSAISPGKASQVPAGSVYGFQTQSSKSDARIIFTRDSGFSGSACDFIFAIDGVKAASVGISETATFYHSPGQVILSVAPTGICSGDVQELAVELKPGYAYQFRGFRNASGDPGISATGRAPYPYANASSSTPISSPASSGMLSKEQWRQQQLDELSKRSIPYEQYQQEYRRIMGQ
ncbi:hypothetical protein HBO32_30935 [Pseudomonas nitroreducens]|uniref:hypothetical protein n=1 Tax=Pseudomonas nitroreducens TaxID=46680 RepID=UPI0014748664|nr:hypothetical protein [Pseudomonas nitroreducens]NMZ77515.1 hypothetical protein [Pseudomonas nitroreducens]